ncbi:TetR/AcrR family transcriptional regulator [Nocardia sp. BMG111209]|uniref:TetR/AcrR family transcriptional regulator n=1 Tax=Nocardia sp. BMG111209 TaxID=1160137 RepID=UPI0003618EE8|nr:TetR/AcrR family transcriptional regulator [Nocardia sp. BMG111209]
MVLRDGLSRTERRKATTRSALIRAGQKLLAEGRTDVSVLEITSTADVGNGSFYNHFATKTELFDAAVDAVLEAHGTLMDELTARIEDPAEAFTQSFRMTGHLYRRHRELTLVVLRRGTGILLSEGGLVPRATRDIRVAVAAGRFRVEDVDLAAAVIVGASLSLGQMLLSQPERDVAETTDAVTRQVLRGMGLPDADVEDLCSRPLPEVG